MQPYNNLPDLMGEALGRFKLPGNQPRNNVIPLHREDASLINIILEKLNKLRLSGMHDALKEQLERPETYGLSFEARLMQLLDQEIEEKEARRAELRVKKAALPYNAQIADLDYSIPRGLVKSLMVSLSSCGWLLMHHNVVITGPAGTGKTFISCALATQACNMGFNALYTHADQILEKIQAARKEGDAQKVMSPLYKTSLLILDNFCLDPMTAEQGRDLLTLLDKIHGMHSVLVSSPLPISKWSGRIADHEIGKAIVDRLVPNAYLIKLRGQSLRKGSANSPTISLDTDY